MLVTSKCSVCRWKEVHGRWSCPFACDRPKGALSHAPPTPTNINCLFIRHVASVPTRENVNMYAEPALKLVHDAKRTPHLPSLPPYAATTVRAVTKEVRDLDREVTNLLAPYNSSQSSDGSQIKSSFNPSDDPATACAMLVSHLSIRRNKRCLLAYHRARTAKLEEMCWAGADIADLVTPPVSSTPSAATASTTASSLSAEEEQYVHQYSQLLSAYKGQWTDIDLTGSLEPPRDIFIDVRVLRDAGEIQMEYGSITLSKNSQFYVRQADVENLIQQGYLQKLG